VLNSNKHVNTQDIHTPLTTPPTGYPLQQCGSYYLGWFQILVIVSDNTIKYEFSIMLKLLTMMVMKKFRAAMTNWLMSPAILVSSLIFTNEISLNTKMTIRVSMLYPHLVAALINDKTNLQKSGSSMRIQCRSCGHWIHFLESKSICLQLTSSIVEKFKNKWDISHQSKEQKSI